MSRLGGIVRSQFVLGLFVLAASALLARPAHSQQIQQVPTRDAKDLHLPSGAIYHDGAPVFVREQFQPFQRGDEGGIAGGPPPTGRCCFTNGDCQILTGPQCNALGGIYMNDGSNCTEFDCATLGRCCINNNFVVTCSYVNVATCFTTPGASYWQPGVTCEQSPCAPFGACCRNDGGGSFCYITAEFLCVALNGVWHGDNIDCSSVNCDSVGACCTPKGCLSTTEAQCAGQGIWLGLGSNCDDCRDLTVGACCIDRFTCELLSHVDCDKQGGTYFGDGTRCDDKGVDCSGAPQIGACCINQNCYSTTQLVCDYFSGSFAGVDEECINVNCVLPGACCLDNGLHCQVVADEAECTALGGSWAGSGTECTSGQSGTCPLLVGKCCLQNPNGTSYCLTLNIDQCFSTPGAVWWSTPGECEDPGAPHCPVFGACCLSSGYCQVIDQNICENIFGGTYKGDGTTCADSDLNGQAEVCERPGDTNGDGHVNVSDLLGVISHWGPCPAPCPWDIAPFRTGDGACNVSDLLAVISNWG